MQSNYNAIWRLTNLDKRKLEEIKKILLSLAYTEKQCKKNSSFCLLLVDDKKITELNHNFLHCGSPTNVLSFPNNKTELGTIYISLKTVCREAMLYGQNVDLYFLYLLCHGFTHLLGYDHGEEMDLLSDLFFSQLEIKYPA